MANRSRFRGSARAQTCCNSKVNFALRQTITRSATRFTVPKSRLAASTTRSKQFGISANAPIHRLISNISKPNSGPKNKTTNAPGKRGLRFIRRNLRRNRFPCLLGDRCLGGGESRDWHTEGTATDVVQTEPMAEFYAVRIAAVLTAN